MLVCAICHRETTVDDVATDLAMGRVVRWCICLACQDREQGTAQPLPLKLRQELDGILAASVSREPLA